MNQHIDTSRANHDIMLLSTVKILKEKSEQKDLEITELKEWNTKKDKTINVMKQDFQDLKKELDNVRKQLTTQMKNNERLQSEKLDHNKENIENLQKFAVIISKLHNTLSNKQLKRNDHVDNILFQDNYDKDENVKKWNGFVGEVNKYEKIKCDYLEILKDSINQYSENILCKKYEERLENLCNTTPLGSGYPFVRIGCHSSDKSICVKSFYTLQDFEGEVKSNKDKRYCKIQNDQYAFSYFIDDTLHVAFWGLYNVYLLHNSDEEKKINLPNGAVVKIENIEKSFMVNDSVLLHLTVKSI